MESPEQRQPIEFAHTLRMSVVELPEAQRSAPGDILKEASQLTQKKLILFKEEKRRLREKQLKIEPPEVANASQSTRLSPEQQTSKFNILMRITELTAIEKKVDMLLASLELNQRKAASDKKWEREDAIFNLKHLEADIAELQKRDLSVLADKSATLEYRVHLNELGDKVSTWVDAALKKMAATAYD